MAKVKIQGNASGTGVLTVTAPNTSTDRTITLPDSTGTLVDSTTAVTKDANGNVGIGVTPESTQSQYYKTLDIASGASVYGHTTVTNRAYFGANQYLHSSGVQKYKATSTASLHEMDSGTHKFKVAASGSADADITFTTGFEVLNDGKARAKNGLLFGTDTAAANALEDYEEGDWSPTMTGSTTTGSYSYDTNRLYGRYTKIGNQVIVRFSVRVSGTSSAGVGGARIAGLPYAPKATSSYPRYTGSLLGQSTSTNAASIFCCIEGTGTYLALFNQTTTTCNAIDVTDADLHDSIYAGQMTYETDS